jgi:hypothetical protein
MNYGPYSSLVSPSPAPFQTGLGTSVTIAAASKSKAAIQGHCFRLASPDQPVTSLLPARLKGSTSGRSENNSLFLSESEPAMTRHCHAIATAIRAAATAQKGTVFLREFASHQLAPYNVRRMPSVNSSRHIRRRREFGLIRFDNRRPPIDLRSSRIPARANSREAAFRCRSFGQSV